MATQPNSYDTGGILSNAGIQTGANKVTYPFLNYPTPDAYARITETSWRQVPANYTPLAGTYTSYKNYLIYSNDLTNGAWTLDASGTGINPTVTAGFVGPDGGAAWRIQFNRGAGTTSGDYSRILQGLSGLTNPHSATASVWVKINSGSNTSLSLRTDNSAKTISITSTWTRFDVTMSNQAATTDSFNLIAIGNISTATVDVLVAATQWEAAASSGPIL
jgi:hypothetical protein